MQPTCSSQLKGIPRGLARPLFLLSLNGKQSTLTICNYEGGCYGRSVSFRIRKMATMKQTRRTIPNSSLMVAHILHCKGMMKYSSSLLWRSLAKTFCNARRLGISVCFISGSLLSFLSGILLIMIRSVRAITNTEHFSIAGHPYQFFSMLPPFATVFKVLRTLRVSRLYRYKI